MRMTSEELDTVAAMLLGQTPIWPPKDGGDGETVTVEGTLFTPQCDSLAVNLASLRREALITTMMFVIVMAGYIALFAHIPHPAARGIREVGTLFWTPEFIVIATLLFLAGRWIDYEFTLGRCRYIFDQKAQCVISGADRRYGFESFGAVAIHWRRSGYVVSLLVRGDRADRSVIGRVRNWGRRRWLDPTVGRYAMLSNARRVANTVAEIMGLEVVEG